MTRELLDDLTGARPPTREVWCARALCGALAAVLLLLLLVAWTRQSQPLFLLFVGLYLAMVGVVAVAASIPRRRQHQRTLIWANRFRELALRDDLTGLFNRRYFNHALDDVVRTARRDKSSLALLLLDLDEFKRINDSYGHQAGDVAIRVAAAAISAAVPREAIVSRVGGDEFAVVLRDLGEAAANTVRLDIEAALASAPFLVASDGQTYVSASAGLARWESDMHAEDLLRAADKNLYAAKATRSRTFDRRRAG